MFFACASLLSMEKSGQEDEENKENRGAKRPRLALITCELHAAIKAADNELLEAPAVEDSAMTVEELLIKHGATASPDHIEEALPHPLSRASSTGSTKEVETELSRAPSKENLQTALAYAAGRGHKEIVSRLLAAGANPHDALALVETISQRTLLQAEERVRYESVRRSLVTPLSLVEQIILRHDLYPLLLPGLHLLPEELRARINKPI